MPSIHSFIYLFYFSARLLAYWKGGPDCWPPSVIYLCLWYVNKISGTNEQGVNFSSKFLQNVGLDKVLRSCKPNFHWTTILAAQLIEIHVWPLCNIVVSCNTIFCCKETNTKRIWRYLNKSLHRWPMQAKYFSAHLRSTIHYDNMLTIICSERYY